MDFPRNVQNAISIQIISLCMTFELDRKARVALAVTV
jgi:hypothetical protein